MNKYEELSKTYLRLNGYFIIDNYIVHNGGADISNSYKKIIPESTELDILGVRFPFQKEQSDKLLIKNDENLILQSNMIDFVIIESKSKNSNKPNSTWSLENINYILRFFGFTADENVINEIAITLKEKYSCTWNNYSIRYIITSENANDYYVDKGLQYITIDTILNFIIKIRGNCWFDEKIAVSSDHHQWNDFMNIVFKIANDQSKNSEEKKNAIIKYLNNDKMELK
jgi:hypothetical protein